uniref:Uncharacterized protein n=1 Tax=Pyricularia oryzae (strain P131) TaxID=1143193 RepID=L7JAH6_PYRO1
MCLDPSFTTDTKADGFMIEISKDLRITLTDEYTNEKKPDDGEFYYKIRQFQGALGPKNPYFEMRWWARLASIADTKNKKQRLQQLLGHAQFGPAFDAFLKIPALYGGMRLSMVNKMICLKCHDVTRADIAALQLTAPGAFTSEAVALRGRVEGGDVFQAFNSDERKEIWSRICSKTKNSLVPSLFQFFENLKYLKGPADCMKMLINPKRKDTIQSALEDAFSGFDDPSDTCAVQIGRHKFKYAPVDPVDRFSILYRHNDQIKALMQQDPDESMARRLLDTARDPAIYRYMRKDDCVKKIVRIIREAEPHESREDTSDSGIDGEEKRSSRCGLPAVWDYAENKNLLFLADLHRPLPTNDRLRFDFIQRSNYFSFFGDRIACEDEILEAVTDTSQAECTGVTACITQEVPGNWEQSVPRSPTLPDNYQEQVHTATRHLQDLEESLKLLNVKKTETETELGQLQQEIGQNRNMNESLAQQLRHLQNEGTKLETTIGMLKAEEARKSNNIQRLEQIESDINHRIEASRLQNEQLSGDETKLRTTIAELESMKENNVQTANQPFTTTKTQEVQRESNRLSGTTARAKEPDLNSGEICVKFMVKEWIVAHELWVNRSKPSEFQRVVQKYLRKGMGTFDREQRQLSPINCLNLLIETQPPFEVYLKPNWEVEKLGGPRPKAANKNIKDGSTAMVSSPRQ